MNQAVEAVPDSSADPDDLHGLECLVQAVAAAPEACLLGLQAQVLWRAQRAYLEVALPRTSEMSGIAVVVGCALLH